ncbi:hypothetical protein BJX76DRAFT_317777 [Aspergillus varians]
MLFFFLCSPRVLVVVRLEGLTWMLKSEMHEGRITAGLGSWGCFIVLELIWTWLGLLFFYLSFLWYGAVWYITCQLLASAMSGP